MFLRKSKSVNIMYFFLKYILSTTVCLAQGQVFGRLPEGGEITSSLSYLRIHLCVVYSSPTGIFPPPHIVLGKQNHLTNAYCELVLISRQEEPWEMCMPFPVSFSLDA